MRNARLAWAGAAALGVACAFAQEPPGSALEREFADGAAWTVESPLAWRIGQTQAEVVVPQGFVHDKASVPRALWSFFPKSGPYTRAAVIHDWLYWAQPCTRAQADNLLMIAMKESGVSWLRRQIVYRGVRAGGDAAWRQNAADRARGLPRFNPYGGVPGNITWPQLRERLQREGRRDPPLPGDAGFCRYGDGQAVPGPDA